MEWSLRHSQTERTDSQLDPRRADTSRTVTNRGSGGGGGSRRRRTGSEPRRVSVAFPHASASSSGGAREFESDPVVTAAGVDLAATPSQSDVARASFESFVSSQVPNESTAGGTVAFLAPPGRKATGPSLGSHGSRAAGTSRTIEQVKAALSGSCGQNSLSAAQHTESGRVEAGSSHAELPTSEGKDGSDPEPTSAMSFCSTHQHGKDMPVLSSGDAWVPSQSLDATSDTESAVAGGRTEAVAADTRDHARVHTSEGSSDVASSWAGATPYTQVQRQVLEPLEKPRAISDGAGAGESSAKTGRAADAVCGKRMPSSSAAPDLRSGGSAQPLGESPGEPRGGRRGRSDCGARPPEGEDINGGMGGKRSSTQGTYLSGMFSSGAGTSSSKAKPKHTRRDSVRASLRWVDSSSATNSTPSRLDEGTFALPRSVRLGSTADAERGTRHSQRKGSRHRRCSARYTSLRVDTGVDEDDPERNQAAALQEPGTTSRQKVGREQTRKRAHSKPTGHAGIDGCTSGSRGRRVSGEESGATAGSPDSSRKTRGGKKENAVGARHVPNAKARLR